MAGIIQFLYEILRYVLKWERRNYPNFICVAVSSEHSFPFKKKNLGIITSNSVKALSLCLTEVKETEYWG